MFALAAVGVILVLGAGCHTAPVAVVPPTPWNNVLIASLEAGSATGDPFVALNNPDASSVNAFQATSDVTSGLNRRVASLQGQAGTKYEFKLPGGLPQDYYLNLSLDIYGTIFISNSHAQAAAGGSRSVEATSIRVEALMGGKLVGGEDVSYNPASSSGPWAKFQVQIRPEAAALVKGESFSIVITRYSGISDFLIGTGGAQQSHLEFRYYDDDPLAGAVYLEKGRFISSGTGLESEDEFLARAQAFAQRPNFDDLPQTRILLPAEEPKGSDAGTALTAAGLGLMPLAFFAWPRSKKNGALLAACVLVVLSMSGCFDQGTAATDAGDDPDQPKPTVEVTYEPREGDNGTASTGPGGKGDVEGFVHDEAMLAIRGAHVSLLGTPLFTRTDKGGQFAFRDVQANTYTMRIDADKFLPIEQQITVQPSKVAKLNITMVYPVDKQSNDKPHTHSVWGEESKLTLASFSFLPGACVYGTTCVAGASEAASTWTCGGLDRSGICTTDIPVDSSLTVPPGTGTLEIILKWSGGASPPKEMALRVQNNVRSATTQDFVPRASGVPFRVAMFPNEADPGHQTFTNWQFYLMTAATSDLYSPSGQPAIAGTRISVEMIAHKGVIPYEPSHRDFWQGNASLSVIASTKITYSCLGCDLPDDDASSTYKWGPDKGSFVPPGTLEVRGTLLYKHKQAPSSPVEWNLWYKPANLPPSDVNGKLLKAKMENRRTDAVDFVITVSAQEADQFYQTASNWLFYPGDDNPDAQSLSAHGLLAYQTDLTITATAYKDQSWVDK